ncbi:MAG: alpha/beta hydrolase [Bradymonadales bacterium]|nr:alpha/beta hydrolase [Bradymonadales bacterium]
MLYRLALMYVYFALLVGGRRLAKGPRRPTWSRRFETVMELVHWMAARWVGLKPEQIREEMARLTHPPSRERKRVAIAEVRVREIPGVWITPKSGKDLPVILYLHGGAYVLCSVETHLDLMARLALASRARVLGIDYRLAPEHSFPAQLDDALAVYRWLLSRGENPRRIVVAGDSAGGGLALATLLALRDAGDPLPAGAVLISPWVDLEARDESLERNFGDDLVGVFADSLLSFATSYAGGESLSHPLISPIHADHTGLPPLLVQVGDAEILHDQVLRLVEKTRAAGVETRLDVGQDMVHVWHAFARLLPEARQAIQRAGSFVRERTAAGLDQ